MDSSQVTIKKNEPVLPRKALLQTLDDRASVLEFYQYRPYSFVRVTSWYNNKEYTGFGFSKVMHPDKWNPEEGADIAKRRALYMIYRQVRDMEGAQRLARFSEILTKAQETAENIRRMIEGHE